MANEREKGWWEEYRSALATKALDLAELEHHASYVRTFQVVHIPGVLQTEEHVRAALAFVEPGYPEGVRRWQKSSFSAGDSDNDCLEIAAAPLPTLHLRESDTPATILSPTRTALHALLTAVKSTTAPGPSV
ncbi:hypothetical protein GCM10023080_097880 [Streptomyces pseudoechinosporeus]